MRPRRRAGAHQGVEAQPQHGLVAPSLQHRAADLRRRPRLGRAGARNAAEIGACGSPHPDHRATFSRKREKGARALSRLRERFGVRAKRSMTVPPTALEIARALIRCRSVTPKDGGALPYLRDLLAGAGFTAELI